MNYCTRHKPCENNATCRNTGHGQYTCECPDRYTGTNCEIRVENCSLQPCLHGATCTVCSTLSVHLNIISNINSNEISVHFGISITLGSRHLHSTLCFQDIPGSNFTCICPDGFTGRYCQVASNSCSDSPCQNGAICIQSHGVFSCSCLPGWTGNTCSIKIRPCDGVNCFNGHFILLKF